MTTHHHGDHLSRRVTSDTAGALVSQQGHYPFGEQWYAKDGSGSAVTPGKLFFTSYERDSESGNDYAVFRSHMNRLGRFTSPDPLAGSIRDPQSLNRYAYVRNDPVNLTDPLGLDFTLIDPTFNLDYAGNCRMDGISVPCNMAYAALANGSAVMDLGSVGVFEGHPFFLIYNQEGIDFWYPGLSAGAVAELGFPRGFVAPGWLLPQQPGGAGTLADTLGRYLDLDEGPGRPGGGKDRCAGFVPPVGNAQVGSPFGAIRSIGSSPHMGDDYPVPVGTLVSASFSGTVLESRFSPTLGNVVVISNSDGYYLFAHLSRRDVAVGASVSGGGRIGLSGNTGLVSGPHLHYEEHNLGPLYDARNRLNRATVREPCP